MHGQGPEKKPAPRCRLCSNMSGALSGGPSRTNGPGAEGHSLQGKCHLGTRPSPLHHLPPTLHTRLREQWTLLKEKKFFASPQKAGNTNMTGTTERLCWVCNAGCLPKLSPQTPSLTSGGHPLSLSFLLSEVMTVTPILGGRPRTWHHVI